MERIKNFLRSVKQELDRVSWPSKDLAVKATVSVIIFALVIGTYLWILDIVFVRIINFLLSLRGG
ncbi:preprotein translocase subunit SecE [Thermocrinis sp.]|jgi:preprotein translocase subunit SecE|uniref:preprotein translocase subunit SecE n=1 Tax=Thermocrinis sp. TaxID=2024383 RepID=UPI0026029169|nr:preprotein translocase subunit SecE [Thermocrinis sp.]